MSDPYDYSDEDEHVRFRLPRASTAQRNRVAAQPTPDYGLPGGVGLATTNRFQFENANQARSNADFAAKAPAALPDTTPTSASITSPSGVTSNYSAGSRLPNGGVMSSPDPARVTQANDARRSAYVGRMDRLSDYLYPGMDTGQFGRDANARANDQSAAGVGQTNAVTGQINTNTEGYRAMLPGMVSRQAIDNNVAAGQSPAMIARPGIENQNLALNPADMQEKLKMHIEQNKLLTQQVAQHQKDIATMRAENDRLMRENRLWRQGGSKETILQQLEREDAEAKAKANQPAGDASAGQTAAPQQVQQNQPATAKAPTTQAPKRKMTAQDVQAIVSAVGAKDLASMTPQQREMAKQEAARRGLDDSQ